jgi:hypothetical protein
MRISRYLGALTKGRSSAESAGRAVRVLPSPLSIRSSGDRLIHITQVRSVRRLHLMHPFLEISLSNSLVRRAFHDSWLAVLRQTPPLGPLAIPPSSSHRANQLQCSLCSQTHSPIGSCTQRRDLASVSPRSAARNP